MKEGSTFGNLWTFRLLLDFHPCSFYMIIYCFYAILMAPMVLGSSVEWITPDMLEVLRDQSVVINIERSRIILLPEEADEIRRMVRTLKHHSRGIRNPLFESQGHLEWPRSGSGARSDAWAEGERFRVECRKERIIPYRSGMIKSHDHVVSSTYLYFETPSDGQDAIAKLVRLGTNSFGDPQQVRRDSFIWCSKLTTIVNMLKASIRQAAKEVGPEHDLEIILDDLSADYPSPNLRAQISPNDLVVNSNGDVDIDIGGSWIVFPGEEADEIRGMVETLKKKGILMHNPLIGREEAILPSMSLISPPQASITFTQDDRILLECSKNIRLSGRTLVRKTFGLVVLPLNPHDPVARLLGLNLKQILFVTPQGIIGVRQDQVSTRGTIWCGNLLTVQFLLKVEIAKANEGGYRGLDSANEQETTEEDTGGVLSNIESEFESIGESLGELYDGVVGKFGY